MTAQPASAPVTILHLSDIHRTHDEPVENESILHALLADLHRQQSEERLPKPDLLVVSGDLTQSAHPDQYEEAFALLDRLKDELTRPSLDRIILVPGNHDINWALSKAQCRAETAGQPGPDPALWIGRSPNRQFWPDGVAYARRLEPFSALYRRIYGRPYGVARRDQFDTWVYPDLGLCFVGLSSCSLVDHRRRRGAILDQTIFAADVRLRQQIGGDPSRYLKIAVWHHDLNWLGDPGIRDALAPAILGHLVDAEFHLALVGHAHRTAFNVFSYPGFSLPIVAAGSLCAGPRQRGESIPRLYNLIRIERNRVRVHTRSRETKDMPWRPYARWGQPPSSYFDVALRPGVAEAEPEEGGEPSTCLSSQEGRTLELMLQSVARHDPDLAAKLEAILQTRSAVSALSEMSASSDSQAAQAARQTLTGLEAEALRKLRAIYERAPEPDTQYAEHLFISGTYGCNVWPAELDLMQTNGWVEVRDGSITITGKGREAVRSA